MGYLSRVELRRIVAQSLGFLGEGYPTTVSGTTLLDVNTAERKREQDDYWNGGTLLISAGTGGPGNELVTESGIVKTETNGGTVTSSAADPFDDACWKMTTTSTAGSAAKGAWTITTVASREVEVSFRAKGDGVVCGRWGLYNVTGAADIIAAEPTYVTGKQWTRFVRKVTLPVGCISARLDLHASSELGHTVYFDTPSVRLLGQSRYVSDWVNSTGTFTVPTWITNPTVGSAYQAFYKTFSLDDYNRAINAALRAAYPFLYEQDEDTSLTTLSSTYAYDLPDNIAADSIIKVEVQADTSTATAPYTRHIFWKARKQGPTGKLQFDVLPPSTRTIRLTFMRPLDPLLSDFDTVDERWVPYLVDRARGELYDMQLGKTSRSDRQQVGENRDAFFEKAAYALRQVQMQPPATHVKPAYHGFH